MDSFILIVEFFGGLFLLFGIGTLISHILKLDKYYDEYQKNRHLVKDNNDIDQ